MSTPTVTNRLKQEFDRGNALVVISLVALLAILLMPLPPVLISLLLTLNIAFALVVLTMTFSVRRALDFSTFPSLLLMLTLFRLVLNLATTRVILSSSGGHSVPSKAGAVIRFFGEFVAGNDPVVGFAVPTVRRIRLGRLVRGIQRQRRRVDVARCVGVGEVLKPRR